MIALPDRSRPWVVVGWKARAMSKSRHKTQQRVETQIFANRIDAKKVTALRDDYRTWAVSIAAI